VPANVQWVGRTVTRHVELSGVSLSPGGRDMARIGSANQDDTVFEDGGTLDNSRLQTRNPCFGLGPHYSARSACRRCEPGGWCGTAGLLFCVLPMRPGSLNDENAQRLE
jgi:cytochrome P450